MSRAVIAVSILVAGLAAGAIRAAAQDVSVDYDKSADFSGCGTYAWAEGQPAENPLVDKRIVEAIEKSLAAKGWRKVQESPSWYVTYRASAREQKELRVWDAGWRFRGMGTVDLKTILNGMLVVDIKDGASRQLVWRGVAKDTVSNKTDKNQQKLAKSVEKMFKEFPPGSGKKGGCAYRASGNGSTCRVDRHLERE